MRCPKCYGKLDKETQICTKCFFNVKAIKEHSSNHKAKENFRNGDGDLNFYSKILPHDLSKKKLALLSGFLGVFGAHYFYIGRMFKAMFNLVVSIFFLMFCFAENYVQFSNFLINVQYVLAFLFLIVSFTSLTDFINILFNNFKVPVYIEETKKNKK